ncbi:MAG: CxxC-x17-CxxC domain-containing protein [Patescibacteria group bacterium]|jgi:CxxC-x17-CxxC domain-containing protein
MKNFNRSGKSFDRKNGPSFDRRESMSGGYNRGGDSDHHVMHKAVCSECGQSCEVPFKPTGNKPVYCSNCFKGKDKSSSNRSFGRDFSKPNFYEKKMFSATCSKCGQSCEVPFRPTGDKPVLCSSCFGKDPRSTDRKPSDVNSGRFDGQLKTINEKLDKILRQLSATEPKVAQEKVKTVTKPEVKKKITVKAEIKKKVVKAVKVKPKTNKKK